MKIIQVSDFYGEKTGHFLNKIVENISASHPDMEVCTSNLNFTTIPYDDSKLNVKITRYAGFRFFKKAVFPGIILKLLLTNADIVHAYVMGFFSAFVAGYLKKIKNYKLVLFADIDESQKLPRGFFGRLYYKYFIAKPAEAADVVTVFTERQKQTLLERIKIKPEKIIVIPSGVDTKLFLSNESKSDLKDKFGLKNRFVVLSVGAIVRKRQYELILEAILNLKDKIKNVVFVHIGTVGEKKYLDELKNAVKKKKLEDFVNFLGTIP